VTSPLQNLVQQKGQNLFVGVDEYDAPSNSCRFSADPATRAYHEDLSQLLNTEFFAVIKKALGGPVVKYWLTGVLPAYRNAISPLLATTIISRDLEYNGLCGLVDEEVSAVAKEYLRHSHSEEEVSMVIGELKRLYSGYNFTSINHKSTSSTLYNPLQVFAHLQELPETKIVSVPHLP